MRNNLLECAPATDRYLDWEETCRSAANPFPQERKTAYDNGTLESLAGHDATSQFGESLIIIVMIINTITKNDTSGGLESSYGFEGKSVANQALMHVR